MHMGRINKVLATVAQIGSRPADGWRFIRQAVHELHVVMQGATQLVADFETRLEKLESEATQRSDSAAPKPRRRGGARRRAS
jgi:hypothetical protein